MKNPGFAVVGMLMLQACGATVPASNVGPGFNTAEDQARRNAALQGATSAQFGAPSAVSTVAIGSEDLPAIGIGETPTPERAPNTNTAISDEQDFQAVSERETIESDAERRAAQAAVREEIQPTDLPTRPANTGPNIVEYAINAPNVLGQEWYSRFIFSSEARFQRNCVKYASSDAAQRDFLARGGPERDRLGIDPDGDGFACGWDPAPFKLVASN